MKIAIFSECKSNNQGDQAIFRSVTSLLSDHELVGISLSDESPPKVIENSNYSRRLRDAKFIASFKLPMSRARIRWYLQGARSKSAIRYAQGLENCDAAIIGGGQLFRRNSNLFAERVYEISNLCQERKIPYAILGVGIDSALDTSSSRLLSKVLFRANYICLRDALSRARAKKMLGGTGNVEVGPDLAFAYTRNSFSRKFKEPSQRSTVFLNIMNYEQFTSRTYRKLNRNQFDMVSRWKAFAVAAIKAELDIVICTSGVEGDLAVAQVVAQQIGDMAGCKIQVIHPTGLTEMEEALTRGGYILASRMHAGILAYRFGLKVVAFDWDDKVSGCWETIGQPDCVYNFWDSDPSKVLSFLISRAVEDDYPPVARKVEVAVKHCLEHLLSRI